MRAVHLDKAIEVLVAGPMQKFHCHVLNASPQRFVHLCMQHTGCINEISPTWTCTELASRNPEHLFPPSKAVSVSGLHVYQACHVTMRARAEDCPDPASHDDDVQPDATLRTRERGVSSAPSRTGRCRAGSRSRRSCCGRSGAAPARCPSPGHEPQCARMLPSTRASAAPRALLQTVISVSGGSHRDNHCAFGGTSAWPYRAGPRTTPRVKKGREQGLGHES